jgi:hypothetical protein
MGNNMLAYYSDSSKKDFLMTLGKSDLSLGATHEVFFGAPNTIAMKQMKVKYTVLNEYVADFIGYSSYD